MKKLLLIILCSFYGFAFATEYTVQTVPNPKTANAHAFVSNPDGVLKNETVEQMNIYLDSLSAQTGAEVAIVAVNSIGNTEINHLQLIFLKPGQLEKPNKTMDCLSYLCLIRKK